MNSRPPFQLVPTQVEEVAHRVIGCAIEVHRELGPGFLESHYENAMAIELGFQRIGFQRQVTLPLEYRGQPIGDGRIDLIVAEQIVVELKAVSTLSDIHRSQLIAYLKATRLRLGILINFNVARLKEGGIQRVIL